MWTRSKHMCLLISSQEYFLQMYFCHKGFILKLNVSDNRGFITCQTIPCQIKELVTDVSVIWVYNIFYTVTVLIHLFKDKTFLQAKKLLLYLFVIVGEYIVQLEFILGGTKRHFHLVVVDGTATMFAWLTACAKMCKSWPEFIRFINCTAFTLSSWKVKNNKTTVVFTNKHLNPKNCDWMGLRCLQIQPFHQTTFAPETGPQVKLALTWPSMDRQIHTKCSQSHT